MSDAVALTPTVRQRLRGGRFWILAVAGILLVALLGFLLIPSTPGSGKPLDPENPAPEGTRAVLEVLRQQGVRTALSDSLDETLAALEDPAATTVVVNDQAGYAPLDRLRELQRRGVANIVLLAPGSAQLSALGSGIVPGGGYEAPEHQGPLRAGEACADPLRENAPTLSRHARTLGFRLDAETGGETVSCYPVHNGAALVSQRIGASRIVAVGAVENLTNENVLLEGNAAFALGVLGDAPRLVWYSSSPKDLPLDEPPVSPAVPPWTTAVSLLALCTAVALMLHGGRRFGPLVTEALPVTVPASETVDGRARLYDRSGARLRALDNIRVGAIGRMASALGLGRRAPAHEVADAAAALLGRPPSAVRAVLLQAEPGNDEQLLALSDRALELERAVAAALRPEAVAAPPAPQDPPAPNLEDKA